VRGRCVQGQAVWGRGGAFRRCGGGAFRGSFRVRVNQWEEQHWRDESAPLQVSHPRKQQQQQDLNTSFDMTSRCLLQSMACIMPSVCVCVRVYVCMCACVCICVYVCVRVIEYHCITPRLLRIEDKCNKRTKQNKTPQKKKDYTF